MSSRTRGPDATPPRDTSLGSRFVVHSETVALKLTLSTWPLEALAERPQTQNGRAVVTKRRAPPTNAPGAKPKPATITKRRPAATAQVRKASYHHGDLRRALVEASLAILQEDGAGALTLREAARRAGVSHAAPKNHFGDLTGLLTEVAAAGFDALADAMLAARDEARATGSTLDGVLAIAEAYVRFAIGSAGHFRAMFHPALGPRLAGSNLDAASQRAFDVLVATIEGAHDEGLVREAPIDELALAAWSLVHGIASLALDEHLARKGFRTDPGTLARTASMHLYVGLRPT